MELGWTGGAAGTKNGLGAKPVSDDTAVIKVAQ